MKRIVVFALILNAALLGVIAQQFIALAGDDGPLATRQNGDVNGDQILDMSDAVYLLIHLFNGGAEPVALADSPELLASVDRNTVEIEEMRAEMADLAANRIRFLQNPAVQDLLATPLNLTHANLENADLEGEDLRGAMLDEANLQGANLRNADLRGAVLVRANMNDADLRGADLTSANLYDAFLNNTNLADADLNNTNLAGAQLVGANLSRVNLRDANLLWASLIGAEMTGADLRGANVENADFQGAIGVNFEGTVGRPRVMPND